MPFRNPDAGTLPRHPLIIGGERAEGGTGERLAHVYPGTGAVTREFQMAGPADVDCAVSAARAAFPAWRAMPGDKRRDLMLKAAALFEQKMMEFVPVLVAENGSVARTAFFHGYDAAQKFRYFAGWADKIHGRTVPMWSGPSHDYVAYEPYGVVGVIVPWNGPMFAATMVLAPALAAGNCIVLKSPDLAPYSAMVVAEVLHEAGFPDGVVNLVTGAADIGEAMVAHPGVDKIEFIGSGATAKKVLAKAAETLKPCGLELGGKSAVIVFDDAELIPAARRGMSGAVSSNGQGCVNGTRLLVQRGIYERYLETLSKMAGEVVVGDPYDPATGLGPVISETSMNRILGMVDRGVKAGGRLIRGGERLGDDHGNGYFLPLTIVAEVSNEAEIAQQEVFGPVLVATPFDTEEEAIALANGTAYGLGAYVHTQDLRRAHHVAAQMEAGMIQVNASGEGMSPNVPFGGWKQSGHGRLGGSEGLHEFLQPKNIYIGLNPPEDGQ